jgi:hypothetical protein
VLLCLHGSRCPLAAMEVPIPWLVLAFLIERGLH